MIKETLNLLGTLLMVVYLLCKIAKVLDESMRQNGLPLVYEKIDSHDYPAMKELHI